MWSAAEKIKLQLILKRVRKIKKNLIRRAYKNGGAPWLLGWKKQRPGLAARLLLSNKARKESSQKLLFPQKKARIDPRKSLGEAGGCGGPLRLPES